MAFGILGIWDVGFWDFGDFGFWILGILGILGILDFGILGILGILDFGDFGFWISGFWGGPGDVPRGNLTMVPGGQRLESPCLPFGATSKPTVSDRVEARKLKLNIFSEVRTLQNHRNTQTSNPLQNKSRRAQ